MRIFLSHPSRYKALVREFRGMLPSFLNTWLDEDSLTWGESFPNELKTAIQSGVDFLIIFLDKDALNSKWVKQELEWAIQREKELKRTFILPILLEKVPSKRLPPGFSDRLFLRPRDFTKTAVEDLAKQVTLKLFQLVVESYSSLQLAVPRSHPLKAVLDELSAGQAKLLANIVEMTKDGTDVPQREIEQAMSRSYTSGETYYRLEVLIYLGFLSKRRVSTAGLFAYNLTKEFREELKKAAYR